MCQPVMGGGKYFYFFLFFILFSLAVLWNRNQNRMNSNFCLSGSGRAIHYGSGSDPVPVSGIGLDPGPK
jgi:hypothetical protein